MKKRLFSLLTALALCLSLLPTAALAATNVQYLDANGTTQTCASATEVTSGDRTWGDDGNSGWYVAPAKTMSIGGPNDESPVSVTVTGNVHLILADGCNLTIYGGIRVPSGSSLTIYGQSTPTVSNGTVSGSTGKLTAVSPYDPAGAFQNGTTAIGHPTNGSPDCDITINGGVIDARGSRKYPGIQGKNVTINGGYVKATVPTFPTETSPYPSGINGQTVTINGGTVNATGGENGAGIGGGSGGSGGTITISGGTVTATGGKYGAGIGGGNNGSGGSVTISGSAEVTATGGERGAGIGGGDGGSGGTINISGGNVTATGGNYGAGIGGGKSKDGGNITISGGIVNATGGLNGAGIGRGYNGTSGGTFTTTASGNAIIKASIISDQSGKASWSGIIFERNDGGVYGTQSLRSAFTVASGETLLIAEGATLTTQGKLTNNGNIYVDGTLSGSVSGNAVYYRLFLTNCTASQTYSYSEKTYCKAGDSVTLTSTTPAGYKFDSWSVTPGSVTISNNSFTMPGSAVAVTANTIQMVKITQQPESKNVTYGESVTLSVTAENNSGNTDGITYQWYKGNGMLSGENGATLTLSKPGAGTYNYYCAVTYGGCTIKSNTATVTVDEADSTVTKAPAAVGNLVYNGSAQALVSAGTANGGTMRYASSENGLYDTTIPKATAAGSYTVWYKVVGDSNHKDSTPVSVTVAISPKSVTVSGITASDKTYDGTTDATLDCTNAAFGGKVDGDTLSVTATGTFADKNVGENKTVNITGLTLGGSSAGNYTLATTGQQATTTANISPAAITGETLTSASAVYTGSSQSHAISAVKADTLTLATGDYTVSYKNSSGEAVTELTNVGSYKVVVTAKDNSNFSGSAQTDFQITKAETNSWITEPSIEGWTYGDVNPTLPSATAKFGTVTVEYKDKDADDSTYSETAPTNAGSYKVRFTVTETDNYAGLSVEKDLTITPKTIGIQWGNTTLTYNGQKQAPTATATGLVNGDRCTITVTGEQTKAGNNYTATATAVGNPNYKLPDSGTTQDFTINQKEVAVSAGTYKVSKTYDGTTDAGTASGALSVSGILTADSGVSVVPTPGAYTSPNVGGQSTVAVSLALNGTGSENYKIKDDATTVTVPCEITARPITIASATATTRGYEADNVSVETDVTFNNAIGTLTKGTDYTVAGVMNDANAGTGKTVNVTVTLTNGNYSLADNTTTTTVTISKIAYAGSTTATGSAMYGNPGTVDLSTYLAPGGSFGTVTVTTNNSVLSSDPVMEGNTLKFAFADIRGNVGKTAEITVPVTGATNCNDYTITVTVTVEAKTEPTVTAPTAVDGLIYNGEAQTLISAGSTTEGTTLLYSLNGTDYSTGLPSAVNAGDYTVYYKVKGNLTYADVDAETLTVTIGKKEVTAAPKNVTITRGSAIPAFELIYTGLLGEDTLTPNSAPTFTCYEKDGTTAVSTRTVAGTYTITWTNTDIFDGETNYRVVAATGTLTINKPRPSNPPTPSQPTDTTTKSPDTGDMGIALYAGMALLSLTGGAWVVNKKRKGK